MIYANIEELKCSKTVPCNTCQKAGVECGYRQIDRKRKPASQDHVILLQSRVAWLEDFILDLQNASSSERDFKLRTVNITSASSKRPMSTTAETQFGSAFYRTSNLHMTSNGSLSFHGPTSIYHVVSVDDDEKPYERPDKNNQHSPIKDEAFKNADQVLRHFDIDIDAEIITQTLLLFFKWQYPNYVFIYRDAFLRDHYGVRQGGKYWSTSLLLSICALGSLMLPESERGDIGRRCQDAAVSIAIVADLVDPSITAVQTFLCLAFCEIGLGNLSKGWAFSGRITRCSNLVIRLTSSTQVLHFEWLKIWASKKTPRRGHYLISCLIRTKMLRFEGGSTGAATFQTN